MKEGKRVFICTDNQFPEGNADSNYIRFFALSLLNANWEVIVIGCGINDEKLLEQQGYRYRGVEFYNVPKPKDRIPFHLEPALTTGINHTNYLINKNVSEEDYIVLYTSLYSLQKKIFKGSYVPDNHIAIISVEWMLPSFYHFGRLNPSYLLREYTFYKYTKKCGKVFAISNKLSEKFKANGCKTTILPMMTEKLDDMQEHNVGILRRFVYPGAAFKKDKITSIIEALQYISRDDLKNVEIHFTGLKRELLSQQLGDKAYLLEEYSNILFFHGWLDYSDLLALYYQMDYLLLFREKNLMTESNFPSKIPELMRYGIIPICSEVGDYTEKYLTAGYDSIIIQGAEPQKCAKAIIKAIHLEREKLLEMKYHAKQMADRKFDYRVWSLIIDEFLQCDS